MDIATRSPSKANSGWRLPALLIALGVIPVAAGIARLFGLAQGGPVTGENARFFASPLPVVVHIVTAVPFCVLGALQLSPSFRQKRLAWHRAAGRALTACGLIAGLTGLWMSHFYPPGEADGPLLYAFRMLFGCAMVVSLSLGFLAVKRRDLGQHRVWMTRAYAIGLGAGTQALVHLPFLLLVGKPGELGRALLMGAGWVINLAVAEWSLRKRRSPGPSAHEPRAVAG